MSQMLHHRRKLFMFFMFRFLCFIAAGDLDEMLKDMNTNLVKQGIRAASKGVCGACGKPVMGEVSSSGK